MKTLLLFLCLVFLNNNNLLSQYDYDDVNHMYVTMEAYELLKATGHRFPLYDQFIGDMGSTGGTMPWQGCRITTGAFREDEEDPVYNYTGNDKTGTHFWDADRRTDGDDSWVRVYQPTLYEKWFPNAYTKAKYYKEGNWPNWLIYHNAGYYYYFMYQHGLANLLNTRRIYCWKYSDQTGRTWTVNEEFTLNSPHHFRIVWEILGRMCHLLQDQTVPAHAHGDAHPPPWWMDCYESYIKVSYQNYNCTTAVSMVDPYINSYGNPLRYLFYTANQLGDYFPSDDICNQQPPQDWDGDRSLYNNINGEGTYPYLTTLYNNLPDPPPNTVEPEIIAYKNMNHAIKFTAGLLYWFAIEAGLQQINPVPTNYSVIMLPPTGPVYRGTTGQIIPSASGPNHWFEFQYRRCEWPPPNGQWYGVNNPLHGVYYADNPSRFVVVNQNYNRELCTQGALLAPGYPVNIRVRACSNGGCTGFFDRTLVMSHEDPPGGCPYVFSTNNDSVFVGENNILHKSTFPEYYDQDITDKYLFKRTPPIMDDKYVVVLAEANNDIDYFDQIKLIAVDHSLNTKVAITEDNQIVLYDTTQIISTVDAIKNGSENITNEIQYINQIRSTPLVTGDSLDNLYLRFEGSNIGTYAIITEMEQDRIYPHPVHKRWAGNINATFQNEYSFQKTFARREMNSVNIIPIELNTTKKFSDMDMNITMLRNYAVNYIAIMPISYSGFTLTELPLNMGKMQEEIGSYNIDPALLIEQDDNYVTLDNLTQLSLYFDYIPEGGFVKRSFILEVNGKYINDTSFFSRDKSLKSSNNIPEKITLYPNYPNPFNPKTLIKFELPKQAFVALEIYNAIGQLVQTLVKNELTKGLHNVEFDGTNLPSGVYFYTLRTENFTESKRWF